MKTILVLALSLLCVSCAFAQQRAQKSVEFNVRGKLVITAPDVLPDAVVGEPYNFNLTATGGKTPYTWRVISCQKVEEDGTTTPCGGQLPTGVTLTSNASLAGTPVAEAEGKFHLDLEAESATGP